MTATTADESAFTTLVERHARELRSHCFRILRSVDQADDAVQETFLRAWRSRATYEGRSTPRAWLYSIATNTCLDTIRRNGRRAAPHVMRSVAEPDEAVVDKEALEQVFLATIQLLPAKQRAVLILRCVLRWRAAEVAELLGISEAAVNSALQRARATLQARCPRGRLDSAPTVTPRANESRLLHRFVDAIERADVHTVVALCAGTRNCARRALEASGG